MSGGDGVRSAARDAAHRLREEILRRDDGTWLGSEPEVQQRLGVSRPTFRQAARLLEAEGLLTVKRGQRGGLFVRRPTAEGVAHSASVYLRAQGATFVDLARAHLVLAPELARLAAANPSAEARAGLERYLDERAAVEGDPPDVREFTRTRTEFALRVAELCESPPLVLFDVVLWALGRTPAALHVRTEPREIATARRYLRKVARAVGAGDADTAVRETRRHVTRDLRWLEEHLPDMPLDASSSPSS